ncbi:hypothetical protein PDE_06191 [Penicillium oxalicum 114-2]|uniref:Uncharacterized protein n=1 Tax=Penicillium oxalicum (strain 114-2 / CGMCC 5302) TaxID=933388 RepID=S7ZRF2_PENO1|nr:hypothetical protein PDE_06191 [Penicillium oxalicum 114-2]
MIRDEITYEEAKAKEANILHQLSYYDRELKFLVHIYRNRDLIRGIIAHHLYRRIFNVSVRVDVGMQEKSPDKQLIIRFPLPYRIGENTHPGNADEKVLCEAGTYAWIEENCADITIPKLYGLRLSTGQTFTFLDNLPIFRRTYERVRRWLLPSLGRAVPSRYVPHPQQDQDATFSMPYLIEYVDPFILSLTRIPLPRIGSFKIDENGYLSLSKRPLTLEIQQLENEHIPVDIPRDVTYTNVASYITDRIAYHESRLHHQPTAVTSAEGGLYQTSALMVMRSIWSCFFRRELFQYGSLHAEFMTAFAEEGAEIKPSIPLHSILQQGWDRGTFWCILALLSPSGLFSIFYDHIQPRFTDKHREGPVFWTTMTPY